jgi:hypothetical protein
MEQGQTDIAMILLHELDEEGLAFDVWETVCDLIGCKHSDFDNDGYDKEPCQSCILRVTPSKFEAK